jgi:hypothetical protein
VANLVVLVINDPDKTDEVLEAWVAAGISGATILDSTGLGHRFAGYGARDDFPIIASLGTFLRVREEPHRTIFAVVPDGFDLESLVAATEETIGATLDKPNTGILFVVPVSAVWGIIRTPE